MRINDTARKTIAKIGPVNALRVHAVSGLSGAGAAASPEVLFLFSHGEHGAPFSTRTPIPPRATVSPPWPW